MSGENPEGVMPWPVFLEILSDDPDHWMEKRWKLSRIERPSSEFEAEFWRLGALTERFVHPSGWSPRARALLRQVDMLVVDEKARIFAERLSSAAAGQADDAGVLTDQQRRYNVARDRLLAEGKKVTDSAVAEKLDVTPRTITQWRSRGLIS